MKVVRTDDYVIKECLPDNLSCVLGIGDPDVCCGFNFIFDMKSQFISTCAFLYTSGGMTSFSGTLRKASSGS